MIKTTASNFKQNYKFITLVFLIIILICSININAEYNIDINKNEFSQGEFIIINIPLQLDITNIIFNDQHYFFYTDNDKKISIIPISYWTSPGNYILEINSSKNFSYKYNLVINKTNFKSSYIEVDSDKKELVEPEKEETKIRKKQDQKLINKARKNSSKQKLWSGKFIWPVEGIITTEYGATRYVNNKLSSRHSGIDIANDIGKPIVATNSGFVKLADNLLVTGNTVIVDHGWNIFSSYSHLSKITVNQGDNISKGDKIGEIGSTGFSTGPHLHWTITINNVFINPNKILENTFFNE